MGLRFRRSIRLGCGIRINISSSGIGYSIGSRGFRTTVSPRGRVTNTISIPGTGLSYSTSHSRGAGNRSRPSQTVQSHEQIGLGATVSTVSADVENFQSAEYGELLKRLKIAYYAQAFALAFAIFSPFIIFRIVEHFSFPPFCAWVFIGIAVAITIAVLLLAVVDMDYELDAETKANFENYCAAWGIVNTSRGKWQKITSTVVTDKKYHSGANNVVDLKPLTITHRLPMFMRTNVNAYCINMHSEKLIVLPDKLIIIRNGRIGAINYDDINISYTKQNIIGGTICSDSEVVGHTWKYVNRNGAPDKRFSDNKRLNICSCGEIVMTSDSGLRVIIVLSNNKIIDQLQ